ncbi:MAG: hypothetical protein SVV03_04410 [Candidatus Nanohaloarchaea archaeon]|nr:hypothetical protein [Candidatus Nanohaloarchaea archaeon]
MKFRHLLREWKVWFLITALVAAGVSISPHYQEVDTGEGSQITLGTNIDKGLDLAGGSRILIKPEMSELSQEERSDVVQEIITTLKTRIRVFGLQDMNIRSVSNLEGSTSFIQVEMAGANTSQLRRLISKQGRFTAGMSITAVPGDTLEFGDEEFEVGGGNGTIIIGGKELERNRSITLKAGSYDIPLILTNKTGSTYRLRAQAFTGKDVTEVDVNPTISGVNCRGESCQFRFQVSVTRKAAERFNAIAQNFDIGGRGRDGNLIETRLVLKLDETRVSALSVSGVFKKEVIPAPSITGGGEDRESAVQEMNELKSVLQSGALPVPIEIVSTSQVSATLGDKFMQTALIAIIMAVIAVALVIFVRYQSPKVAIPIMITGLSEVFILLGVFSTTALNPLKIGLIALPAVIGLSIGLKKGELSSLLIPLGFILLLGLVRFSSSLDLAAIAGIIAAVGTGVDDQIIITDEKVEERSMSLRERLKRAFFIIFTSAASTIGAMTPVMTIGAGAVQGFALTTILGVIIGISVTRPAYAAVIEKLDF